MQPTEKPEGDKGFTVTDRRQFGNDGEPRAVNPSETPTEGHLHGTSAPSGAAAGAPSLPEIDFGMFVLSLASSAVMQLGELPQADGTLAAPNLPLAKQTIDILGMLEQKTRGNLSSEERQLLQQLLFDLRLKYVESRQGR